MKRCSRAPNAGESARGLGMMKDACRQVLVAVQDSGVRYVSGFIGEENVPSLKVAEFGGFESLPQARRDRLSISPAHPVPPLPPVSNADGMN